MIRKAVSKKKRRFTEDGFNLDLTYITQRIIAMGWPSTGGEALYRNPLAEVRRLFHKHHDDNVKVYNLCLERSYPDSTFKGLEVNQDYLFLDHNAPPLEIVDRFCLDVEEFLCRDMNSVVAVHCKAGKGRTGTLISALLLHISLSRTTGSAASPNLYLNHATDEKDSGKLWSIRTAQDALEYYAEKRTYNNKGVTIPSQIRYVQYYEKLLKNGIPQNLSMARPLLLTKIIMRPIPHLAADGGCDPYFQIWSPNNKDKLFDSKDFNRGNVRHYSREKQIEWDTQVKLAGDAHIVFLESKAISKDAKICNFWFNSYFVTDLLNRESPLIRSSSTGDASPNSPRMHSRIRSAFDPPTFVLLLKKSEIDKAQKEKNHKIFDPNFEIELQFQENVVSEKSLLGSILSDDDEEEEDDVVAIESPDSGQIKGQAAYSNGSQDSVSVSDSEPEESIESLKRQIIELKKQLEQKEEMINKLNDTFTQRVTGAATSMDSNSTTNKSLEQRIRELEEMQLNTDGIVEAQRIVLEEKVIDCEKAEKRAEILSKTLDEAITRNATISNQLRETQAQLAQVHLKYNNLKLDVKESVLNGGTMSSQSGEEEMLKKVGQMLHDIGSEVSDEDKLAELKQLQETSTAFSSEFEQHIKQKREDFNRRLHEFAKQCEQFVSDTRQAIRNTKPPQQGTSSDPTAGSSAPDSLNATPKKLASKLHQRLRNYEQGVVAQGGSPAGKPRYDGSTIRHSQRTPVKQVAAVWARNEAEKPQ